MSPSDWRSIHEKPSRGQSVLVWHRMRPYCRYYEAIVGWWNGEGWFSALSHFTSGKPIYQPVAWKYIDPPPLAIYETKSPPPSVGAG